MTKIIGYLAVLLNIVYGERALHIPLSCFLESLPDCIEQRWHADMNSKRKDVVAHSGTVSSMVPQAMSIIVALTDDAHVTFLNGSERVMRELAATKKYTFSGDGSELQPFCLHLKRGEFVAFPQDKIHHGDAYRLYNVRLHLFVDPTCLQECPREHDAVYYPGDMFPLFKHLLEPDIVNVERVRQVGK